ncbi:hypothetical protein [Candidatus Poriferisodalis sp.]|uniref:hypothetical protein n=1 Tax=Candidatus Poriferisodalis sp. TaxID=3101277 RepID=UPI003B011810
MLLPVGCVQSPYIEGAERESAKGVVESAESVSGMQDSDIPVPSLIVASRSGRQCRARLLEADWSYPRSYVQALAPPTVQSFPVCTFDVHLDASGGNEIGLLELSFGQMYTLPDVLDITWFERTPESDADVLDVTECAIAVDECHITEDRRAIAVMPPANAVKAGVWAMWLTPQGVDIGPDSYGAFNTAFWGVSLR